MEIKIRESKPDGKNTFRYIAERLDTGAKNASDMRDLFTNIVPEIKNAERYAFSQANPSGWASLKASYKKWKAENLYPITIGIRTGGLKTAASTHAIVKIKKKKLEYRLNPNVKNRLQERVGDYAKYFDSKRPVFSYARKYINTLMKKMAQQYIKDKMVKSK